MVCAALILTLKLKCFHFIIMCLHAHVVHTCRCTCHGMCMESREQSFVVLSFHFYFSCRDWIHIVRLVQQGHLHAETPQWPEMLRDAQSPHWPEMLRDALSVLTLQLVLFLMQSRGCANALYKFCLTFDVSKSSGSPQVILRHKTSLRCIH